MPSPAVRRPLLVALVLAALVLVTGATGAAAAPAATSGSWNLWGSGWGHGVGMSQYGARQMAADGADARDILAHYYSGTDYSLVDDRTLISVNLRHGVTSSSMSTSALSAGGGSVQVRIVGGARISGSAGARMTFAPTTSGVKVTCSSCTPATTLSARTLQVVYDDGKTLLDVDGTSYRDGYVFVRKRSSSATSMEVVGRMRLHDKYLDYIREVPWSWPKAALEAQAAAARGFALNAVRGGVSSTCQCHVYDTTQSQVYGGYPSGGDATYWPAWRAAVRAAGSSSRGYVATYGGAIIDSVYSSSSGGRTQNSEDVWGGTVPYLRSVDDHWSLTSANPRSSWSATPSRSSLAGAFGLPDVERLDLSRRFESGAVASATARSSGGGTATISGASLASRLGLYSTYVQRPVRRITGSNRYALAAAVAADRPSSSTVVIASGADNARPMVVVSGPLAQAVGGPLLLTGTNGLPAATRAELDRRKGALTKAVVIGGPRTVGSTVVDQLHARGLTVSRISGANRYELSTRIARRIAQEHPVSAAVVVSGAYTEALAAAGPAGAVGEPVVMTSRTRLVPTVSDTLVDLGVTDVRVVGNTSTVSGAVEDQLAEVPGADHVVRTGGSDRYAVAAAVAQAYGPRLDGPAPTVLVNGSDASLTVALTAGSLGRAILLVTPDGVPSGAVRRLQETSDLTRLDVVGGTRWVPTAVSAAAARS